MDPCFNPRLITLELLECLGSPWLRQYFDANALLMTFHCLSPYSANTLEENRNMDRRKSLRSFEGDIFEGEQKAVSSLMTIAPLPLPFSP